MTDTTTQPTEADADAQAMAAAKAGYAARKGTAEVGDKPAPAPAAAVIPDAALAETTPPADDPADDEPNPPAQQKPQTDAEQLKAQLEDLRAQVREMKASGADAKTVREMHGQIGEINASLKKLTAPPPAEPEVDALTASIAELEQKAEDFPEMGGAFLKTAKALRDQLAKLQTPEPSPAPAAAAPAQPDADPEAARLTLERNKARADLLEIHNDYFEVRNSDAFKAWFAAKPAEYQTKAQTSWNPAVVAEPVTAFKAHLAAQKRKQDRLDANAAVQTPGTQHTAQPTTLTDAQAARRGYERYAGRRS